ncbi:MAG: FtsX-like permease family protein [Myxococcales bacterium FL481]|nr:MAG: FtsX-like permease family protein [Myxococcales bacterium FL481]
MNVHPAIKAMANDKSRVAIIVAELALTMAIIVNGIAFLTQALERVLADTGVDAEAIAVITSRPFWDEQEDMRRLHAAGLRDLEHLRRRPDVEAAATVYPLPLQGGGRATHYRAEGAPEHARVHGPVYVASPGVIDTLGLKLVAGRAFEPGDLPPPDTPDSEPVTEGVTIITQALADALFPDGDALGKVIHPGASSHRYTAVGIVEYMRTPYGGGPMEERIGFFPSVVDRESTMSVLVRVKEGALADVLRTAPDELAPHESERVIESSSLTDVAVGGQALQRFLAKGLAVILFLLVFTSALAVYGVSSAAVARRRKQIGTWRALGATRQTVARYFLLESFVGATVAMALGVPLAFAVNFALQASQDAPPLSPEVMLPTIAGFWGLAMLATLGPARRAAKIPPALASKGT